MKNDIWIWLSVERRTGLIVGCHVGKRNDAGAAALWDSLSEDCKKNGIFFTDGLAWSLMQKHFRLTGIGLSAKEAENKSYRNVEFDIQAKVVGISPEDIVLFKKH